jgi:hypothetical protein
MIPILLVQRLTQAGEDVHGGGKTS